MIVSPQVDIFWHPPPATLDLAPRQIDIWSLPLDRLPCRTADLAPEEVQRLERFRNESGGEQYCASRTALRSILGNYLNCPADRVPLLLKAGGKPRLAIDPPPLYFNLSHTRSIALLAVSSSHKVGIDVETQRQLPDSRRIAQRIFSQQELSFLQQQDWKPEIFYQLWTALEARQKCLGRGVFGKAALDKQLEVRILKLNPNQHAAIAWPANNQQPTLNFYRIKVPVCN